MTKIPSVWDDCKTEAQKTAFVKDLKKRSKNEKLETFDEFVEIERKKDQKELKLLEKKDGLKRGIPKELLEKALDEHWEDFYTKAELERRIAKSKRLLKSKRCPKYKKRMAKVDIRIALKDLKRFKPLLLPYTDVEDYFSNTICPRCKENVLKLISKIEPPVWCGRAGAAIMKDLAEKTIKDEKAWAFIKPLNHESPNFGRIKKEK